MDRRRAERSGKTTLVSRRLANRLKVINPDVIAQELPRIGGRLDERGAGEIAIAQRNDLLARGENFAIETTLTGNSALRLMRTAKAAGYKLTLVYVGLASAEMSLERVTIRIGRGGHSVPTDALQRRYPDTMAKLAQAVELADRTYLFDNTGRRRRLLLIRERGGIRYEATDWPAWAVAHIPERLRSTL